MMSLLSLPLEIRNEIYGHVFDESRYYIHRRRNHINLNILYTCAQLRDEALHYIYSHKAFGLYIDTPLHILFAPIFDAKWTHLIQDIAIEVSLLRYNERYSGHRKSTEWQYRESISELLLLSHPRRVCHISFVSSDNTEVHIGKGNFLESLKMLVGFEAVIIEIRPPARRPRRVRGQPASDHSRHEFASQHIQAALQPLLGPAVAYMDGTSEALCVKFQPQKYSAKMALEEKGRPNEEMLGLSGALV